MRNSLHDFFWPSLAPLARYQLDPGREELLNSLTVCRSWRFGADRFILARTKSSANGAKFPLLGESGVVNRTANKAKYTLL